MSRRALLLATFTVAYAACSTGPTEVANDGGAEPDGRAPGTRVEAAPIPVGLDAYRYWDRMYRIRLGARTYMRSTYDRSGGNEGADASHFLRQAGDTFVTLDIAGPGVVYFVRTNHWHGSPWHYIVDGNDLIVTESSTLDPLQPVPDSAFMPETAFPKPLAYTWSTTRGADLSWVPVGFNERFTLAYERTHYGTGYYIYQTFPRGADNLTQPLRAFAAEAPDPDVLALLGRAGEDVAENGAHVAAKRGAVDLAASQTAELARLDGPQTLVALKLFLPRKQALAADGARLRIFWDDATAPAVDAPLPLFFGTGTFFNRADAEWLVRGLLFNVRFTAEEVQLASYFPMPFMARARVELVAGGAALSGVRYELRTAPYGDPPAWAAHFHATYRDHGLPQPGKDLVLLDTTDVEGSKDREFCGSFVGTSFIFSDQGNLSTLEGDPRFFFDDSASPQAHGTGTEEWAGGGDYWGGETMTLPLAGHPVGVPWPFPALAPEDLIQSAYRVLIADAMPFGKNARIQLEHGGLNDSLERYRTLVYWYGRPGACLVQTDALQVGDEADERAHGYVSATASAPVTIRSRYDSGGADGDVPELNATGRSMTGTTEFTLAVRPDNHGVLLRRTLDYAIPDQRAEVFIADDDGRDAWQLAGTWYSAGSTRSLYSNPPGELDPPAKVVQTSNRRLRDDEFLISAGLTERRSRLRVRIVFTPEHLSLAPDDPLPDLAWSELRYVAYASVMPTE